MCTSRSIILLSRDFVTVVSAIIICLRTIVRTCTRLFFFLILPSSTDEYLFQIETILWHSWACPLILYYSRGVSGTLQPYIRYEIYEYYLHILLYIYLA